MYCFISLQYSRSWHAFHRKATY